MKWSHFVRSNGDDFAEGDTNLLCEISGLKIKASEAGVQWDGVVGRRDLLLERNPQDYRLAPLEEKSPTFVRTEPDDTFTSGSNDGSDL